MNKYLKYILIINKREWIRIYKKKSYMFALFFLPFLLMILIFSIYINRSITKVPTIIVDYDKTIISRKLINYLSTHRYINILDETNDFLEAKELFKSQKISIIIVIPKDFEKKLKTQQQPVVKLYSHGANLLIGKIAQKAILETVLSFSGKITVKSLAINRNEFEFSKNNYPPIVIESHNLFNPTFNYDIYMPAAILITLIQMIIVLLSVNLISSEYEANSIKYLLKHADNNLLIVYIGKLLPLISIMTINTLILHYIVFKLFKTNFNGNFIVIFLIWQIFIWSAATLGISLSTIFKNSSFATELGIFITAPAFAFSGYAYPINEFPFIHKIFASIMPSTYFIKIFIQYSFQKNSFKEISTSLAYFLIYFSLLSLITLLIINFRNKQYFLRGKNDKSN